jgi:phosphohistidine phosphatase SixA
VKINENQHPREATPLPLNSLREVLEQFDAVLVVGHGPVASSLVQISLDRHKDA